MNGAAAVLGEEDQCTEKQHHDHDRQQPPFLVLSEERPELAQQALALSFGGRFLELAWVCSVLSRSSSSSSNRGRWPAVALKLLEVAPQVGRCRFRVPSMIPVQIGEYGEAGRGRASRNINPMGVNSPKNITARHDLRDRPADRECQDHPADVDQSHPLRPSQPERTDRQCEDGKDRRQAGTSSHQALPKSQPPEESSQSPANCRKVLRGGSN